MEPRWYTVLFWPNRDKNGSSIITTHVINQVKKFLKKSETEFPNKDSYKQLKKEILRILGPRPETRPAWTSFIPGQGIERRNLPAWTGLWLLSSCHQLFVEEATECSSKGWNCPSQADQCHIQPDYSVGRCYPYVQSSCCLLFNVIIECCHILRWSA